MRERIGPVASFKTAVVVERLPKTRSGKILRGTMRQIADGEEYTIPATIDDPAILGEITDALLPRRLRACARALPARPAERPAHVVARRASSGRWTLGGRRPGPS